MPSLEMLKKLLDEFSEKEAHTREEINVITEQIGELEKRILTSQQKLSTVAADREKVRAMQARYSGGSTLTPGTPLVGSKPVAPESVVEEPKEPRPRPGRAGSAAATVTQETSPYVAPLNVRASSTRIPAMTPAEAPTPAVAETAAAATSSPFLSQPEAPAAQPKAFSPLDLFGSPDEPQPAPASQPEMPASTPEYSSGASYTAGVSYEYQNAQPAESASAVVPTAPAAPVAPALAQPEAAAAVTAANTSAVGEITTSFFTPMGSTEATLQPSAPLTQPDPAAQPSLFLDPTKQAAQTDDSAQVQDLDDDEPDDTVKSINDALRGLFR